MLVKFEEQTPPLSIESIDAPENSATNQVRPDPRIVVEVTHSSSQHAAQEEIEHRVSVIRRCSDVQEDDFIGPLSVIARRQFHWIPSVTKTDEIDTLHHATVVHIETGDDPYGSHAVQGNPPESPLRSSYVPARPGRRSVRHTAGWGSAGRYD